MLTFPAILVRYNCAGFSVFFPQQAAQHQICTTCTKVVRSGGITQLQHKISTGYPYKYPTKSRQKNEAVRIAESKMNQNAIKNREHEPAAKPHEARGICEDLKNMKILLYTK